VRYCNVVIARRAPKCDTGGGDAAAGSKANEQAQRGGLSMNEQQVPAEMSEQVHREANGAGGRVIDRLAERLGGKASVSAVYGSPIERDGITVIPVARIRLGFGAGSGRGRSREASEEGSGEGGGGGMTASPMGFIEIAGGTARFQRIADASSLLPLAPLIVAIGFASLLIFSGLGRLIRD
jgi:uncharacterized spore protein YtfJ